jgi:poly [ADP-ribose] polymerase
MANVLETTKLIFSDAANNNNKFWFAFIRDDGSVLVQWGRVGFSGDEQTKDFGSVDGARSFVAGKLKEKERKGYTKLNVVEAGGKVQVSAVSGKSLEDTAAEEIGGTDKRIIALVKFLTKQNIHNITSSTAITYNSATGLFQTPLGVVTQGNLDNARVLLGDMSEFVNKGQFGVSKYLNLISDYLRLIPQNVGMKIRPESLYPDLNAIQKQNSILDSLQASLDQLTAVGQKVKSPMVKSDAKVFNVKLELIEDSREIDRITSKVRRTMNSGHACAHLKVQKVYGVEIQSMKAAFEVDGAKLANVEPGKVMELYHGSKISNIISIFHKGLIIPPANASFCTGRLMGAGAYFSDQSTKSLNYSYGYWDGTRNSHCFMFLADVGLGKWYVPNGGGTFEKQYREGYNSIFAKAGRSGIVNNEFVVPRVSQCNLTRLIEFGS